jgi:hypothetical protein
MSLAQFQMAFGAMVADLELCRAVCADAPAALASFDLSPREIRRLADMAGQPGMRASCKLHRANRLTPLHRFFPRTLTLLGPALRREIDLFWQAYPETRLQFEEDATAFADFLTERITAGAIAELLVAEILNFETAAFRLFFLRGGQTPRPGRSILPNDCGPPLALHPLIAVATFRHEPKALFALIDAGLPPPASMPIGSYYLLLDARSPDLRLTRLSLPIGRALTDVQAGKLSVNGATLRVACAAGLLVQTTTNSAVS